MEQREKAKQICHEFATLYADAECALHYETPFQLLVATILSAQCTDVRVNQVTPALFKKYPTPEAFTQAKLEDIEKLIHSTGFYKNKAKSILETSKQLVEKHQGQVPRTMGELIQLRGVGRKTANVVLGEAFDIQEGVVVDTHVGRLSRRLGLTRSQDPIKVERDLMKLIPQKNWSVFSHWMIFHGRQVCGARKPKCQGCTLTHLCTYFQKSQKKIKAA